MVNFDFYLLKKFWGFLYFINDKGFIGLSADKQLRIRLGGSDLR